MTAANPYLLQRSTRGDAPCQALKPAVAGHRLTLVQMPQLQGQGRDDDEVEAEYTCWRRTTGGADVCCWRSYMREALTGEPMRHAIGRERGDAGFGAADVLSLAGAPTFAVMALLTAGIDGGPPEMLCSATQHAFPLNGMALMYLLMSAFHSASWLTLLRNRRNAARRACTAGRQAPITRS